VNYETLVDTVCSFFGETHRKASY